MSRKRRGNMPVIAHSHLVRNQAAQMRIDALGQNGRVVTAFENADHASPGVNFCHVAHDLRQFAELFDFESKRANWIGTMAVEPRTYNYKFGPYLSGERFQFATEQIQIFLARRTELHRQIARR